MSDPRNTYSLETLEAYYSALVKPRLIEEKMLRLIRQNRLAKWFSGYGQEAICVGAALVAQQQDYLLPMHRNLGAWTTRGVPLGPLMLQLMGKAGGYTEGRDRTFHFGLPAYRIIGMISQLGAMLPVADGLGLAAKLRGSDGVAFSFSGEGATREGDFHEALSIASIWKLPVVFIVENNGYGLSTPTEEALAVANIADAAAGYGMPGVVVDGNDLLEVVHHLSAAARHARSGDGPTLVEMKTFRVRGHEEASGTAYVPKDLITAWEAKDPIRRFKAHVLSCGLAQARLDEIEADLTAEIEVAVEASLAAPRPVSTSASERTRVFAHTASHPDHRDGAGQLSACTRTSLHVGPDVRFIDGVSEGLRLAMTHDPKTILMGQDIAAYGGVFKVTKGFLEAFGEDRVRNTPILESGIIGTAMGLALDGFRPIVEIQYADFVSCGFNQIANNLATTHYRWGASLPITIRMPFGGGIGAGPFHSQSMEAWFTHVPGLKVVIPSTPQDARDLLLASIADPNPVLFFEHKLLYRALKDSVSEELDLSPLGHARCVREGRDVTIVTYGVGVQWAHQAADRMAEAGYAIEIIDLRTLVPWDRETVTTSVRKTHRVLVLHEAPQQGGWGGEIAAELASSVFEYLDAPPRRLGSEAFPIPFERSLEKDVYSADRQLDAVLTELLTY